MFIDTHCHLDAYSEEDFLDILSQMKDHIMIVSGVNDVTNQYVFDLCNKYENIYGVVGIHPEEVDKLSENSLLKIEEMLSNSKIVGIGEIGLDYHYTKENIEKQKDLFIKQIELAKKYKKTIVIHSRDAIQDTYEILDHYRKDHLQFVMHAYSGSVEMASRFVELGVKFGVGGVVTFKNAGKVKEVVETFSLEHFVLETDSPYLTPEPYRGALNKPYYVSFVAQKIAQIKKMEVDEVLRITSKNAISTFDLPISIKF